MSSDLTVAAPASAIGGTSSKWTVTSTGELQPATDNANDIGDATHQARSIYAGTSFLLPGGGSLSFGSGNLYRYLNAVGPRTFDFTTGFFTNWDVSQQTGNHTYAMPDGDGTIGVVGINARSVLQTSLVSTGNTAATETDLRTVTLAAGRLATNGESVAFDAGSGTFAATASVNKRIKVYFGGTAIFDSGALAITSASTWRLTCNVYRVSATVVRCSVILSSSATAALTALSQYTEVTGLTLSGANILKITGNGTNASDVTAEAWQVTWQPAF